MKYIYRDEDNNEDEEFADALNDLEDTYGTEDGLEAYHEQSGHKVDGEHLIDTVADWIVDSGLWTSAEVKSTVHIRREIGVDALKKTCLIATDTFRGLFASRVVARVLEDEYKTWDILLSGEFEVAVRFTVRDGSAVVFILQSEFKRFQAGSRFRYNSGLSFLISSGDQNQTSVPASNYVLMADNSEGTDASPPQNFDDDPVSDEPLWGCS